MPVDTFQIPVTQRAYTLRLRGEGTAWREALWATHQAVNYGAKVFGDWLLTLRGGLCHTLADMDVPAKGKKPARKPTQQERRNRRILLSLSWLSVEDERGAPSGDGLRVATGGDAPAARGNRVKAALRDILKGRGLKEDEIEEWLRDCGPSLDARIREDAVWVNRSKCFDVAVKRLGNSLAREEVWDILEPFFGTREAYFAGISDREAENEEDEPAQQDGKAKDLVQKAGQWLSARFGTGEGADFNFIAAVYEQIAGWASQTQSGDTGAATVERLGHSLGLPSDSRNVDGVLQRISGPGYKSATRNHLKTIGSKSQITQADLDRLKELAEQDAVKCKGSAGRKGTRPWANKVLESVEGACGFSYLQKDGPARHREFAVILDHAARRASMAHSWIKRAEQRRQEFDEEAKRLEALRTRTPRAVEWLDRFCMDRSSATGANAGSACRIRRRALGGKHSKAWKAVALEWARNPAMTVEERIDAVHAIQSEWDDEEKFGEERLFKELAEASECVWQDPTVLIDYVAGKSAEYDRTRFKVPAYRHPDALRHPIFCDFGNSRWRITFACHVAAAARNGGKRLAENDAEWVKDRHGLRMGLWNGSIVDDVTLRWSSKRLTADLALDDAGDTNASDVTRADRLGRAAASAFGRAAVMNVFEEAEWNGRLQAPRAQLDRIATLLDKGKTKQAETLRYRLRWLLSFSPRLRPSGPFIEYAASHGIEPNRRTGEYYPNAAANKGREGLAKLVLSRLPGLRILSVDLGHRFAVACAVWETLSVAALKSEIAGLNVVAGGSNEGDLYLHVEKPGRDGKPRTVIYRRIGPDKLIGGDHPAPWARLDRQFLIKLQGEEEAARWAARQETDMVRGWEKALGRVRDEAADPLRHRVDELMAEAVTMLRRALRRHGDRARIAFNLTATQKPTAGGGQESLDRAGRVELLTHTLALWYGLFSGERWGDPWAAEEWKKRGLPEVAMPEEDNASSAQRRARRKALEDTLRPHAERLVEQDLTPWAAAWSQRWKQQDGYARYADKDGRLPRRSEDRARDFGGREGWYKTLAELERWIAPRGLHSLATDDEATLARKKAARATARHVGGLSLTRISTISGLYQLLKAFKMRPEPDDLRKNIPKKGDDELADFNRRLLHMRDRLREQRVKQLASRIVEAALGIGRIKIPKEGKSPERPRQAVDAPCHAVVIESLTRYRPDDLRTRRENRQLMQWSSAKVQKYLKESCQLYGLHVREVPANYTSRQCSRTGLPGMRCDDVPVEEFLTAPWCNRSINAARKKIEKNGADARDRFLVDLADRLKKIQSNGEPLPAAVRVPRPGGELFVAAPPWDVLRAKAPTFDRLMSRAVQADLNAAANIGLRALLDPDWAGRWWYVPCKSGSSEPATERVRGSAAFEGITQLPTNAESPSAAGIDKTQRTKKLRKDGKEIENLWRDPAAQSLGVGPWKNWAEYWNDVQARVIRVLRKRSELA